MPYRWLSICAAAVLLIAFGCHKEPATKPATQTAVSQTVPPPAPPATYDLQFIDTMSKHHRAEIDMATTARSKLRLLELKALATRIPADRQKDLDQMQALRDQWYLGAPSAENMDMPGMKSSMALDTSRLESMQPGPPYDAMFIDTLIPHHEGAIELCRQASTKAEHADVRILARVIIDTLRKEIARMQEWKTRLRR